MNRRKLLQLRDKFRDLRFPIKIVIIQIGSDAGSDKFVQLKKRYGRRLGLKVIHHKYPQDVQEIEVIEYIQKCNLRSDISGIMIQSPLYAQDFSKLCSYISPLKDFDGLNLQLSSKVNPAVVESILYWIYKLSDETDLKGRQIVIINDSNLLGKPLANILLSKGATVVICNKFTSAKDLCGYLQNADIVVSATGVKGLVKTSMLNTAKNKIICVDAGFPFGDFENDTPNVVNVSITPVPGGVGPITIEKLFENLYKLVCSR